jgi:hypothetical protein
MNTLRTRTALTALALATAIATSLAQVQTATQQPPDSVVAVVADAQGLPLVPPDQIPFFGTFWEVRSSLPCLTAPLPFPPVDTNTPVYAIGDPVSGGQFLVDETGGQVISPQTRYSRRIVSTMDSASIVQAQVTELQNFIAQVQVSQAEAVLRASGRMDALTPDGQDGGVPTPMGLDSYAAGDLWLSISQITNGVAPLVIHGTVPDVLYEIWSKQTLTDTVWFLEGSVPGAPDQDWTPTTVTVGTRTNSLFLRCRSWVSSSGSGIPDWWLLQYGLPLGTDAYSLCASGDGWTILQAYQNGWNPNLFYTPPPPQNVTAVLNALGTSATVTWTSGGGPVTNYAIFGGFSYDQLVSPTTLTFTDSFGSPPYDFVPDWPYTVRAYFANGSYADSQPARFTAPRLSSGFAAVRGPGGQLYLAVASVPPDLASVRVYWEVWDGNLGRWVYHSIDVNAANFVSGAAPLPLDQMTGYHPGWWLNAQCISTNGSGGTTPVIWPYPFEEGDLASANQPVTRFVDASAHLKENLKFLLCSATLHQSFSYGPGDAYWGGFFDSVWEPETYFARPSSPASYEYYGFHTFSSNLNYSVLQELRPAQENYLWRNFAYDPADFDASGQWNNGVGYERDLPGFRWLYAPNYQFTCTNCDPLPVALSVTTHPYLYSRWIPKLSAQQFSDDLAEIGISVSGTNICLAGGLHNAYGLALDSVLYNAESPGARRTLDAGGACNGWYSSADYFCKVQPPTLGTFDYYFASQTRYLSYDLNGWPGYGTLAGPPPPLPGSPTFSITNTSPLLITGFGQPITVSGWAKQTIGSGGGQSLIGGGGATQYAYLEQYFDQAYTIGADGNPTTNSAGLLSPYGEFFPMQPGPAALLTMPDIETGQRGTGVVNVIKLALDVNHDGTMDLSFGGPDNTSQARPYVHWLNNDYDRSWPDNDDGTNYEDSVTPAQGGNMPDCNYSNSISGGMVTRMIPTKRDLEDYARLWVCGIDSNLVAKLPPGSTITLNWGDVGNPNPNNPTIDLFNAVESDGGIGYLTNTAIAAQQINPFLSALVGRIGPGQSLQLFPPQAGGSWSYSHFIWCGVSNGTGALTLTIKDGNSNTLAQTSAYIQLQDIKLMYERWTVGDQPSKPPTNTAFIAQEDMPAGISKFEYGAPTSTNTTYILLVHGWNMSRYDKDRFAETAFKRLYWQGYQGRFGVFRWPTDYGFKGSMWQALTDPRNFDNSEFTAWRSAQGLLNKLNALNAEYPGHVYMLAHSMGNVVAGEALRLAGANRLVNTYVASQAAVPAHDYDATVTAPYLLQFTYLYPSGRLHDLGTRNYGPTTPNIYGNWFAGNNGATGRRVNFYNVNDFALAMPRWGFDQIMKPDTLPLGTYLYTGSTNDPPPWNSFAYLPVGSGLLNMDIVNNLQDRYEAMAYAAEPRSTAFGATPGVANTANLDLTTLWPADSSGHSYADHFWHSAEFRGDNTQEQGYWHTLLFAPATGFNVGIGSP